MGRKHFTAEDKRVAIELRKAGVPLKKIRDQLQISAASLKRVLAHARNNPDSPVVQRKKGTGRRGLVESMPRRLEAVRQNGGNATKY